MFRINYLKIFLIKYYNNLEIIYLINLIIFNFLGQGRLEIRRDGA